MIDNIEKNSKKVASLKPFLRWAGGKQNIINRMAPFLPSPKIVNNYFEPFLGAGSLFFYANYKSSYLSDINPHLINCYQAICDNPTEIARRLNIFRSKVSSEYYYKIRTEFNHNIDTLDTAQAARFIFLVHTSFNGIYRVNRKGQYNVPVGKLNPCLPTLQHLKEIGNKLRNARLACHSYEDILHKCKVDDFIYLDPPYPPLNGTAAFQHYTKDKFPMSEQKGLANFGDLLSSKGCMILISNADLPQIRDLYKRWHIDSLETVRYVSCKKIRFKIKELIIRNY